jgi:arginine:pyruvate transaminase
MTRREAGDEIVMLSIGEPDTRTPSRIVQTAIDALEKGRTHYSASRGEQGFLEALCAKYSTRTGRPISPEQAIFMPGSHTALYAVCHALIGPGDDVLLPEPYYTAYHPVVASTGAHIVHVQLRPEDDFRLTMTALEESVTPTSKALLINNPHNPTGAVLTQHMVEEVARFCRDHDLWLISDEVYEHLVYDGHFASPFDLDEYAEGVAVVSSVSKSHSMTGWRCGWAIGSPELITRTQLVAEAMMFGAQPFLQDAAAFALTEDFDECEMMRSDYQRRAMAVAEAFAPADRIHCYPPQAGIFVMLDVRSTGLTGVDFASRLLDEQAVATMPGESFGPTGAGHIRLSLTVSDDELRKGCDRILSFAAGFG